MRIAILFLIAAQSAFAASPWVYSLSYDTNSFLLYKANDANFNQKFWGAQPTNPAFSNAVYQVAPSGGGSGGVNVTAGTNATATTNGGLVTISGVTDTNVVSALARANTNGLQGSLGFIPLTPTAVSNSSVAFSTNAGTAAALWGSITESQVTGLTSDLAGKASTSATWDWTTNITGKPNFATNGGPIAGSQVSGTLSGMTFAGNNTNATGATWTGGETRTNWATGNWMIYTNGKSTWGPSNLSAAVTIDGPAGTVSATAFSGNGAGLTALNASAITAGTVPLAQLPSSLVTTNTTNTVIILGNGAAASPSLLFANSQPANQAGLYYKGSGSFAATCQQTTSEYFSFNGFSICRDSVFGFGGQFDASSSADTGISRSAANAIAFGNGTAKNASATIQAGNGVLSGSITATNGNIFPAVTGPPAIAQPGAYLRSDGTNLLVVFQDAGGNKTTNKVSLAAYP